MKNKNETEWNLLATTLVFSTTFILSFVPWLFKMPTMGFALWTVFMFLCSCGVAITIRGN